MNTELFFQIVSGILVPLTAYLFNRINECSKELNDFKVRVAQEYSSKADTDRIIEKIDRLQDMILKIQAEITKGKN